MIREKIKESQTNLGVLLKDSACLEGIEKAAVRLTETVRSGHTVFICGNGGSAADAQHFAGEFVGRFYRNRRPFPCLALTTDTSTLTAIANDFSYEEVFSRQLQALGKKGDLLIGITTSGSSKNVLKAIRVAKEMEIKTLVLTGANPNAPALSCDLMIQVPSVDTPRIQEMHLLIEHILAEIVEKNLS